MIRRVAWFFGASVSPQSRGAGNRERRSPPQRRTGKISATPAAESRNAPLVLVTEFQILMLRSFQIRTAETADLPAIRDIYNHYVRTSTCTYQLEPETEAEGADWFERHGDKHPVVVAEIDGLVVGWGSLSPWKERAGYARSVEASVYVHVDWQRRGVGKSLLLDLLDRRDPSAITS